jgi:ABC-type transport system involved in cytochrome bd biosynthesis fused ATPase/permease subunit
VGEAEANPGIVTLNGVNIQRLARRSVYKRISYTGQEQVLFSGSILENLTFNRPHEAVEVEKAISFGNLTSRFPGGVDKLREAQWAGEAGLSGGEQQKLTLARLRLREVDAFLLDEPTAHLDANSIIHFSTQLASLSRDKLVVVASHEPEIMQSADRLLVMNEGRLILEGTFEEVSRSPDFKALGLHNELESSET